MKINFITLLLVLSLLPTFAQSVTGKWKTIDDETGKARSIVNIYEKDGKIYGDIMEILNPQKKESVCSNCVGSNKDKPILGMTIIEGLNKADGVYDGGTILNPSNGKVYKCRLKFEDSPDKLQVRGYIAFFYKTQYWERLK
jgi:uncharacterized protein (DUF2147 family)